MATPGSFIGIDRAAHGLHGETIMAVTRTERGLSSPQIVQKKGVAEFFGAVGRSTIAADWKIDWKVRAPFCLNPP